eukprot:jgi/Hompol1/6162/HPOL_004849-RA
MNDDPDLDDPVEQELDVYLSNALASSLFLLQFPTRPLPFSQETLPKTGRIKPTTKTIQLDVVLDTQSSHYDTDSGNRYGVGVDPAPDSSAHLRGHSDYYGASSNTATAQMLETIKLESRPVPINANYMVGVTTEYGLHLKSVASIMQLRQSLEYIDKISEKEKLMNQRAMMDERKEEGFEEEAKLVHVKTLAADDKDAVKKASLADMQREHDAEPWKSLEIYGPEHSESLIWLRSLSDTSDTPLEYAADGAAYLNTIAADQASRLTNLARIRPDLPANIAKQGMTLAEISQLQLVERLKAILLNAHLATFSMLHKIAGEHIAEETIIAALKSSAVLIRGVWVLQSEQLYTSRPCDARRVLLGLFVDREYVSRGEFVDMTHLLPNMALNMLKEIADLREGYGWHLKIKDTDGFANRYPDLVIEQEALVRADAARSALPASLQGFNLNTSNPHKQVEVLLTRLFEEYHVCSKQYLVRSILQFKGTSEMVTEELIDQIMESFCTRIRDVYVLKTGPYPAYEDFRSVVIELFQVQERVKKSEMTAKCLEKLQKAPNQSQYAKVMNDIAVSKNSAGIWTLKPSPF